MRHYRPLGKTRRVFLTCTLGVGGVIQWVKNKFGRHDGKNETPGGLRSVEAVGFCYNNCQSFQGDTNGYDYDPGSEASRNNNNKKGAH